MGSRLGARRGEILSLLTLLDNEQQREALEYDLIALGLRLEWLGTHRLSWRDLWVVVRQAPRESAYVRATSPDTALWGLPEFLLAASVDAARVANWQRGAARRHEFPKPIPRPGVEPDSTTLGSGAISMEEMAERLGWNDAMTPWRPSEQTDSEVESV